jgi:Fe(3+) dicitrate transport protein
LHRSTIKDLFQSIMQKSALLVLLFITTIKLHAQTIDTSKIIILPLLEFNEQRSIGGIETMPDTKENVIYAGKKLAVIRLDKLNADLSINNTRQVFGKVPGMTIWENDGSGIQAGIAARGLSPNRSWEFNVRQNGYDISSEVFGYPETYFTPPMEALETIEVVRGAASLQYGPQFGGLINYKIKKGDPNKLLAFETQQTAGSYGLFNTFNAVGGTYKKLSYYGYLHHRSADGWRSNSQYQTYTSYIAANYQFNKKMNLGIEYNKMDYKSQQAGGLTDQQFYENHRQSSRARNWFGAPFQTVALTFDYQICANTSLKIKSFGNFAARNSVGYLKAINIKDSINPKTDEYTARQVDRDDYENYGTELRMSSKYKMGTKSNVLTYGVRVYKGNTDRNQLGTGSTGSDFDLVLTNPVYGRALKFRTVNYAAFVEHIFYIGNRFKIVPGARFEMIENSKAGYINTTSVGNIAEEKRSRNVILYGAGAEFKVTSQSNIYANYSTAFRPVTYSELTPNATIEIIDPNLKDASGFNADLGYRGALGKFINFDLGVFYLSYENRIGTIIQDGTPYKTNIGASVSQGVESYIEVDIVKAFISNDKFGNLTIFTSNAFIDAKYTKWNNPAIAENPLTSIKNKQVEYAPSYIHRFGTTYIYKKLSATFQYNTTAAVYTDAANTVLPNAAATVGKLPAYQVMDLSFSLKLLEQYNIKAGVNNLTDEKYATRRAGGYPGPGILPGNGRTFFVSFGAKF